jgi:integrase
MTAAPTAHPRVPPRMSSHYKLPSGKHRFQIDLMGVRESATFMTKKEGQLWADSVEAEVRAGRYRAFPSKTFKEALERYSRDVSAKKPGARWEANRIISFIANNPELVRKQFADVDTSDMAAWRDTRLKTVSGGTVQREINLLSNVFMTGKKEWKWRGDSPITDMKKPGNNPARTRRTDWREVKKICRWLGYRTGHVQTKMQEVAIAYLIALRNGMRPNEILQLGDTTVDFDQRVATIWRHKTFEKTKRPREVPLLPPTLRLMGALKGRGARWFTVSEASRDALFRKACKALRIEGLTFRDSRAELLTRLAQKGVNVELVARLSGHKDLNMLLNTYYRQSTASIARQISQQIGARST